MTPCRLGMAALLYWLAVCYHRRPARLTSTNISDGFWLMPSDWRPSIQVVLEFVLNGNSYFNHLMIYQSFAICLSTGKLGLYIYLIINWTVIHLLVNVTCRIKTFKKVWQMYNHLHISQNYSIGEINDLWLLDWLHAVVYFPSWEFV